MMQLFTEAELQKGVDLFSTAASTTHGGAGDAVGEIRVKAGLPLHVSWTTFYTGLVRNRKAIARKNRVNRPLLLTSAIKNSADGVASQRGFLASWEETIDHDERFPAATGSGASVMYYSTDVQQGLTITVDLFEKSGKNNVFKQISQGLSMAAAFPPLAFASGFLLIGSQITTFTDHLVDGFKTDKHSFESSQQIYVDSEATALSSPRYTFFSPSQLAMEEQYQIKLSDSGKPHLVHKEDGRHYGGDNPYVICRYVQQEVPGLLDYDLQAQALELLKGWTPKQDVDPQALLGALTSGIQTLKDG